MGSGQPKAPPIGWSYFWRKCLAYSLGIILAATVIGLTLFGGIAFHNATGQVDHDGAVVLIWLVGTAIGLAVGSQLYDWLSERLNVH